MFLLTLVLIREGRLRAGYSLFWLFSALVLFILPFFKGPLRLLAHWIGVEYPLALFFIVGIILLTTNLFLHSITISSLSRRSRDLAQKLAILEMRLYESNAFSFTGSVGINTAPLKNLLEIGRELRRQMHLPDFLDHTLELATRCVKAYSGSLMVFDEAGNLTRYLLTYSGKTTNVNVHESVDTVEKGLAGWVLANRKPALVSNTYEDPRWIKRPWDQREGGSRSAMSVPLVADENIIGVLTVVNPREGYFSEYDLTFLMNVAMIISQTSEDCLTRSSYAVDINQTIDRAVVEAAHKEVISGS